MGFPNKMTSRSAAIKRYGKIDFNKGVWPDEHKWMKLLEIPEGLAPNWKVMDLDKPVKRIYCNIDIHAPLIAALEALKKHDLHLKLKTFDGCFNIRPVRGSTSVSTHSYGLSIDINAKTNPMGYRLKTDMSKEFVKCFTDQGFDWGGAWWGRKDPMHFSYAFE